MVDITVTLSYDPDINEEFDGDAEDFEVAVFDALVGTSIGDNLVSVEMGTVAIDEDWPLA
jgi:hypothetical protein